MEERELIMAQHLADVLDKLLEGSGYGRRKQTSVTELLELVGERLPPHRKEYYAQSLEAAPDRAKRRALLAQLVREVGSDNARFLIDYFRTIRFRRPVD